MEVKKLETNSLTDRQKELLGAFQKYNCDTTFNIFTKILKIFVESMERVPRSY